MKVKTRDLTDLALDWAVAKAEGVSRFYLDPHDFPLFHNEARFCYSTNQKQGGEVIDREQIGTEPIYVNGEFHCWWANRKLSCRWSDVDGEYIDGSDGFSEGPTRLIAAMRCFVASRLGDEVEIPDELIKENNQ